MRAALPDYQPGTDPYFRKQGGVLAAAVAKIELDLSGGGKVIALPVRAVAS